MLSRFRRAWRLGTGRHGSAGIAPDLPAADLTRLREMIARCLEARGGEVSARARAAELGEIYLILDATGRRRFLELLATEYDVAQESVEEAIEARRAASNKIQRREAEVALRAALVPPRIHLLSQFTGLAQGVKFLVDIRAELRKIADTPALRALDHDLHALLASWFDVGFLELRRITWRTPAALLEKLIEYEAVHAIRSWDDLKNRLEADRRCYAYFHPNMPDEPLIFVQVALVRGLSDNIQALLDLKAPLGDPEQADTAIFYSISNCQKGLAGVGFGSFLIKRVVDDLVRDLPRIKTFATLSPAPGFRRWLQTALAAEDAASRFTAGETRALEAKAPGHAPQVAVAELLADPNWIDDQDTNGILRPILMRLCAHYLIEERHDGQALDRVANFHLSNGARIERLNWRADTSATGLRRSAGIMVNYRYLLDEIEPNHEAYSGAGKVRAAPAVRKLLKT